MKKIVRTSFTTLAMLLFLSSPLFSQTPGVIYKPSSTNFGKSVLDPNGDGFISTTNSGFSTVDFGVESELPMIAMPMLYSEPVGDISTGPSGGHTDLVSDPANDFQSSYILVKEVNGEDYIIVRMRIGKASTASKGYSLLINSDPSSFAPGLFGNKNPGFDREIVLQTGSRVAVYEHGISGGNPYSIRTHSFDINEYHQRSVAISNVGGNPDYFYDFFVPFSALNISKNQPLRFAACTIISANSGINGNPSDFLGIDDSKFNNNPVSIMMALITSFPPASFEDMSDPDFTFGNPLTAVPTINPGINTASTSISGTSIEADGTSITVYKNGIPLGTITVNNNAWTVSGIDNLQAGDIITARAEASNKDLSSFSNPITVTEVPSCYVPVPVIGSYQNGQTVLNGTWSDGTSITAGTVQVRVFINNGTTEIFQSGNTPCYVGTNGSFSFNTQYNQQAFSNNNYYITVTKNGCQSGLSNPLIRTGTITTTPTIETSAVYATTGNTTVQVKNLDGNAATLTIYVNGALRATSPSTIVSNGSHDFSLSNLMEGDIIIARAQTASKHLSNISASKTVTLEAAEQSGAPSITGTYVAGSNQTITGISSEPAGSVISVYSGDVLLGTTTVTAFGTWSLSGVTLTGGSSLTAYSKTDGKNSSDASDAVIVANALPSAPSISGNYVTGTTTISGTGGNGTVRVYVDGAPLGSSSLVNDEWVFIPYDIIPVGGNWTLLGLANTDLYKGAVIHATNIVNGTESLPSASKVVEGITSFCITDENDQPLTDKRSGESFTLKIIAKSGSDCSSSTFTPFNGSVNLSANRWLIPSGTTPVFENGVLILENVSLGGATGLAEILVIDQNDPTANSTVSLNIIEPAIWVGTTSTDFNTASNWLYNYVPGAGADIKWSLNAEKDCYLDTDRMIGSIDFNESPYKLHLNGYNLEIRGIVSNNNTSSGSWQSTSESSIEIKGYGNSGSLYFSEGSEIGNLTLNNTADGEVSLANAIALRGILSVENGTLHTQGNLTLKSNDTHTAIVAPVTGTINGEVIVERYYPAKRAFRFVSSPVTTSGTIRDNWQEGVNNTSYQHTNNQNPNPGFGTHITGSNNGSNGFDITQTTNPSMFEFNHQNNSWNTVANTNATTLEAGKPYRLLLRGDRSINYNLTNPTPTATILRATGTLATGTQITSLGENMHEDLEYIFIGNPYQSSVDTRRVLQASSGIIPNTIYYWDPTLNTRGVYVALQLGANPSEDLISGGGNNTRYIQPGQAGFVKKLPAASSVSIVFEERFKYTGANATATSGVFRQSSYSVIENVSVLRMLLFESGMYAQQQQSLDGLIIKFDQMGNDDLDEMDVQKMFNLDEDFASKENDNILAIQNRSFPSEGDEITLYNAKYRHQNYTFKIQLDQLNGMNPSLWDTYLNIHTPIQEGVTMYHFSVDIESPGSIASDRFRVVFNSPAMSTETFDSTIGLYPNPSKEAGFYISAKEFGEDIKVNVYNMLGQEITFRKQFINANTVFCQPTQALPNGIYSVRIETKGRITSRKWIFKQ